MPNPPPRLPDAVVQMYAEEPAFERYEPVAGEVAALATDLLTLRAAGDALAEAVAVYQNDRRLEYKEMIFDAAARWRAARQP